MASTFQAPSAFHAAPTTRSSTRAHDRSTFYDQSCSAALPAACSAAAPVLDRPICSRALADVEMAALEGKLALLESQRQLSAIKCAMFVGMLESTMEGNPADADSGSADGNGPFGGCGPFDGSESLNRSAPAATGAREHSAPGCERLRPRVANTPSPSQAVTPQFSRRNSHGSGRGRVGGGGGSSGDERNVHERRIMGGGALTRRRSIDLPSASALARCASWREDMVFYNPSTNHQHSSPHHHHHNHQHQKHQHQQHQHQQHYAQQDLTFNSPRRASLSLSRRRSGSFRSPTRAHALADGAVVADRIAAADARFAREFREGQYKEFTEVGGDGNVFTSLSNTASASPTRSRSARQAAALALVSSHGSSSSRGEGAATGSFSPLGGARRVAARRSFHSTRELHSGERAGGTGGSHRHHSSRHGRPSLRSQDECHRSQQQSQQQSQRCHQQLSHLSQRLFQRSASVADDCDWLADPPLPSRARTEPATSNGSGRATSSGGHLLPSVFSSSTSIAVSTSFLSSCLESSASSPSSSSSSASRGSSPNSSARLRNPWSSAVPPMDPPQNPPSAVPSRHDGLASISASSPANALAEKYPPIPPSPPCAPASARESADNKNCANDGKSKSRRSSWRRCAQAKGERAEQAGSPVAGEAKPLPHRRLLSIGGFASSLLSDLRYK